MNENIEYLEEGLFCWNPDRRSDTILIPESMLLLCLRAPPRARAQRLEMRRSSNICLNRRLNLQP